MRVQVYKTLLLVLGLIPVIYSFIFLCFYWALGGREFFLKHHSEGALQKIKLWISIIDNLGNAWLTAAIVWIIIVLLNFILFRVKVMTRYMWFSGIGILAAIFVDYFLGLNGGSGSWYAQVALEVSKRISL